MIYLISIVITYVAGRKYLNKKNVDVPRSKRPSQLIIALTGVLFFVDASMVLMKTHSDMVYSYVLLISLFMIISIILFGILMKKIYRLDNYRSMNYLATFPLLVIISQPIAAYFGAKTRVIFAYEKEFQIIIMLTIFSSIFSTGLPNMFTWLFYDKFDETEVIRTREEKIKLLDKNEK